MVSVDLVATIVRDFQSYVAINTKDRKFFENTYSGRKYEQLRMMAEGILSPTEIIEAYKLGTIEEHVSFDFTTGTIPTTSEQWRYILAQRREDLWAISGFVDQDLVQALEKAIPQLK